MLLGPVFIGMPMATFGGDHLAVTESIAGLVPKWIPWHMFWAYLVGCCLIAGGLCIVTRRWVRPSAAGFGIMMLSFVVLMDVPSSLAQPHNRLFWMLALRELCFGLGALSLAFASSRRVIDVTRVGIAGVLLIYGAVYLRHPELLPGVPLDQLTPAFIPLHALWGYPMGVALVVTGLLLLANRMSYMAAAAAGITILVSVIFLSVPFMFPAPGDLNNLNVPVDNLLFCGSVLCLALGIGRPRAAGS